VEVAAFTNAGRAGAIPAGIMAVVATVGAFTIIHSMMG
jgi:hypothetical protein